jgi:hypothetical protein
MSGLIREDAGDLAGARLAYDAVLAGRRAGAMDADVRGRREVVRRAELRAEVTSAGTGDATLAIGNGALANGGSGVITSTTSAGSGGVRTIAADVSQVGGISLQAPLTIAGQLVDPAGVPSTYTGNGNALTVSGLNVSGAVFDDMPLTSIGGSLTLFTGSTFQNMDPTVTQLTIEHPGTLSGLVSFSTLTFATAPTPGVGYYMRVTDTDPATLPLAIDVLLSSPLTGQLLSLVSGGATLLW